MRTEQAVSCASSRVREELAVGITTLHGKFRKQASCSIHVGDEHAHLLISDILLVRGHDCTSCL